MVQLVAKERSILVSIIQTIKSECGKKGEPSRILHIDKTLRRVTRERKWAFKVGERSLQRRKKEKGR